MRLEIEFPKPLDSEQRTRFLLAIAALAKSRSVRWIQGGHAAEVMGEAMGRERVGEALRVAEIPVRAIHSSLTAEEDEQADDQDGDDGSGRERLRPIGR